MKMAELKGKTSAELNQLESSLREEGFHLRLRAAAGQLKQTANIRKVRRDLARVLTAARKGKA